MNWAMIILGIWIAGLSVLLYQSGGPSKGPGLLIAIAILVVMDLSVYLAERAHRRRLVRLGEALDEGTARLRVGLFTGRRVEGHFRGRAAKLMIESAGKGRPSSVIAQLACSSKFHFSFWKAARIRIGTARNSFQVNDSELDREFSFVSEDPDRARTWFLTADIKGQVVAILRLYYCSCLEWKKGFLFCTMRGYFAGQEGEALRRAVESAPTGAHFGQFIPNSAISTSAHLEVDRMRRVLDSLSQLAASLEKGA